MWDCIICGCKAIAASLGFCPMCFQDRAESDSQPLEEAPEVTIPDKPEKALEETS